MSKLLINKSVEEHQELDSNNQVTIKKSVTLDGTVIDEQTGDTLMNMRTTLLGDGATPQTLVYGSEDSIVGFNDDGTVRIASATKEERDKNLVKLYTNA